jgi:hypothetical protein
VAVGAFYAASGTTGARGGADGSERVGSPLVTPVVEAELDWERFSAAYFPHSSRHGLRAIGAYDRYKRSRARPVTPPEPRERETSASEEAAARWEDEGGRTS